MHALRIDEHSSTLTLVNSGAIAFSVGENRFLVKEKPHAEGDCERVVAQGMKVAFRKGVEP